MDKKIRSDFPALQQKIEGKPPVYFDNACVTLKPKQVIQAERDYEEKYPGCTRSIHTFGKEATEHSDKAREAVQKFIGAKKSSEIVFTKNTTEGINLIAHSLDFQKGDMVLGSDKEHNSNLVPWLYLSKTKGLSHQIVKSNTDNTFSLENFEKAMSKKVKLVSIIHTSNLDGVTNPAREIIKIAHDHGALVLLDAAQSVPHQPINVRKLDVDFLAFSGHKTLGPAGTGIFYGKEHLLEKIHPFMLGGETVLRTEYTKYQLLGPPEKFEAGLQNYSGIIGLGEAVRYLQKIGLEKIHKHETELNKLVNQAVLDINGKIIGPQDPGLRGGITSFEIPGLNMHDIATILNNVSNVMVRSGQHCVHSWFHDRKIEGSVRSSLYLYNTKEEVKVFAEALQQVAKLA